MPTDDAGGRPGGHHDFGRPFQRKNKWSDYAILYRGNHQARDRAGAAQGAHPYTISGGQSFFDKAEIKDIISYLRLLANTDDDPAFIRAVTTPRRGVGQSTLETLGTFSGQWQCSLFEAVFKGGIEALLADRQLRPLREFCNFINDLESRASRPGPSGSGDNAAQVLDDLLEAINYENYLYDMFDERAAQSKWQNVLEFVNWLKDRGRGGKDRDGDEKNVLELTQMVALMSMLEGQDEDPDAVRMSTLHASKGAGVSARVPGRLRGRHPAAQGRCRRAGRIDRGAGAGRTPPDVRRHHARAAHAASPGARSASAPASRCTATRRASSRR
jgi:ATP-dependent DNA helicase Rep